MTRQRLLQTNPAMANLADDQIRQFLIGQKIQAQQRGAQLQQLGAQARNQVQPPLPPQPQVPPAAPQASRPPVSQPSQAQATPQAKPAPKAQPPVKTEPSVANTVSKGTKRPNEDTAEPTTKAQPANVAPPAPSMVPSTSQQGIPNMTQEQLSKLPANQQNQIRTQLLLAQNQKRATPPWSEVVANISQHDVQEKYLAVLREEEAKVPPKPVVQYTQEARMKLQAALEGKVNGLRKVDQTLRVFHHLFPGPNSDNFLRDAIRSRTQLSRNVDLMTGKLAENLTLNENEIGGYVRAVLLFVSKVLARWHPAQGNSGQPAQPQQQTQQAADSKPLQLNAANLKTLEQASRQQQKVPQAPTTDRAPNSFAQPHAQSPRGTPTYFKEAPPLPGLAIPNKKKQKLDHGSQASTPGPKASPRIGTGKASPELKRGTPPERPVEQKTFKCGDKDCDYNVKGFLTQPELEAHYKEAHSKIEDPVKYAVDSMTEFLDLSAKSGQFKADLASRTTGKPAPVPVQAPNKAGQTPSMPQNMATPVGGQAAATPMSRVPTQPGIKSSPSTSMLKTPQATGKVTTPSTGVPAKATPASVVKPALKEAEQPIPMEEDEESRQFFPAMSLLDCSYDDIYRAFDAKKTFTILDLKDEDNSWALREISPLATPDSSSKDTPSTRQSDISENDKLDINIDIKDYQPVPSAWYLAMQGDPLPLDRQLSDDIQLLGLSLPPQDPDDYLAFYGDNFNMDIDSYDSKLMDGMTLDPSVLGSL